MKPKSLIQMLTVLGGLMLVAGISMIGYAAYAAFRGVVHVASRSTAATIYLEQSPLAFLIGISLYLAGGVLFLWIARVLLTRAR